MVKDDQVFFKTWSRANIHPRKFRFNQSLFGRAIHSSNIPGCDFHNQLLGWGGSSCSGDKPLGQSLPSELMFLYLLAVVFPTSSFLFS
jgi:hypothetical protein